MKSKQSIYIPFVKGNRSAGEHTVDLMRQMRKGHPVVSINPDGTLDIGMRVEIDAPVEVAIEEAPVEIVVPEWNSKTKKADLILIAEGAGLEAPEGATKADIIELLEGL